MKTEEELAFDDLIDVLEELPANLVDKILNQTTKAERDLINTFLNYKLLSRTVIPCHKH